MDELKPTPHELWKQAGEDKEVYLDLLVTHGLAIRKDEEPPEGVACLLVLNFRGNELKMFDAKMLPAIPKVGDLIDGNEVLAVKAGTVPIVILLWSKDRGTRTSKASIPPAPAGSSSR